MKLTGIRYCFNENAALKKFNSTSDLKMSKKDLYLLFAICEIAKRKPVTKNEIFLYLKGRGRTSNQALIKYKLTIFVAAQFVQIAATKPTKYNLAISGRNYLNAIEKLIKRRKPIVVNRSRPKTIKRKSKNL